MAGCCTERGLALGVVGAGSVSSLLGTEALTKANGRDGDGEDAFEEKLIGGVDTETAGRGEGVFGAEAGGVRFLDGEGVE